MSGAQGLGQAWAYGYAIHCTAWQIQRRSGMLPDGLQTRTQYSYHRSLHSICCWNGDTRQDDDQYPGCIPSVLDAVWTCKGTLVRRRGRPQQRNCESSP
eukprot:8554867-Pyramimonas_sp.AAC.1